MRDLIHAIEAREPLRPDDVVVDTGSNDGTMLSLYREPALQRIGFEPSDAADESLRQHPGIRVIRDYFTARPELAGRARVLTSVAMFYYVDDPERFARDVAATLRPDGLWVIQVAYLPSILERTGFDAIAHEQLTYYELRTLEPLLERAGFFAEDAQLVDLHEGTIRLFLRKERRPPSATLLALRANEAALGPAALRDFATRVETTRDQVRAFVATARDRGEKIHGYGASTNGNTLLQFFGLGRDDIAAIWERQGRKCGRETVATRIPIIPEREGRQQDPPWLFILPWHFATEFIEREHDYLQRGGALVIPLPRFRIVRNGSHAAARTAPHRPMIATPSPGIAAASTPTATPASPRITALGVGIALALWALAVALRSTGLHADPYGDEAVHYFVAKHLWHSTTNVLPNAVPPNPEFFLSRPLFFLLLHLPALASFSSMRMANVAIASLIPVLGYLLVRQHGAGRGWALVAGTILAIEPVQILWTARLFPDGIMTTLFIAALWLRARGHVSTSNLLLVASAWVKETALVGLAALLLRDLWRGLRARRCTLWPLHLDKPTTAWIGWGSLAALPLVYYGYFRAQRLPGWSTSKAGWEVLDLLLVSAPLAAFIVYRLVRRPGDDLAFLAASVIGFYLFYRLTGHGIDGWYSVLPATLALLAATLGARDLFRASTWPRLPTLAVRAAATALLVVILVAAIAPGPTPLSRLAHPTRTGSDPSIAGTADLLVADRALSDLQAFLDTRNYTAVLLVDVAWHFIPYPFAERYAHIGFAYTDWTVNMVFWREALEDGTNATVLKPLDRPLNEQFRADYAKCTVYSSAQFIVLEPPSCPVAKTASSAVATAA